jgi:hypothetical protein
MLEDSDEKEHDSDCSPVTTQTNDFIITLNHLLSWLNKEKRPNFMVDIFACIYKILAENNFDSTELLIYDADALKDDDIFDLARQQYELCSEDSAVFHPIKQCLSNQLQEALIALFSTHILPDELLMERVFEGRLLSPGQDIISPPIPFSNNENDSNRKSPPLITFFRQQPDTLAPSADVTCSISKI